MQSTNESALSMVGLIVVSLFIVLGLCASQAAKAASGSGTGPGITPIITPIIPPGIIFDTSIKEAESQVSDLTTASDIGGFTGSGFLQVPLGGAVTFPVTVSSGKNGLHQVELRYALPEGVSSVDVILRIDSFQVKKIRLVGGALGVWDKKALFVKLASGDHTLEVSVDSAVGSQVAVLLDHLRFTMTPPDQDRFLEYPKRVNAKFFNGSAANTRAYYATIDPTGTRLTFDKFLERNEFTSGGTSIFNENLSSSAHATYLNNADLNFGRDMYVKRLANGDVASYVQNYASVEDAVTKTNLLATVAMEYRAPDDDPTSPKFTTFYVYDADGKRINSIDLDGRGAKFVPTLCTACHGGKPKANTQEFFFFNGTTFITIPGKYQDDGEVGSKWIPWDLDNFKFAASKDRASQETQFRKLNRLSLCTNAPSANKILMKGWYDDPSASCSSVASNTFDGDFVPSGWAGHESLYRNVVAPSCRSCHSQRGTYNVRGIGSLSRGIKEQSLEFNSFSTFESYKDEIESLVFDQGMMPAAKVTYEEFWRSNQPVILDNELFNGLAHQNPPTEKWPFSARNNLGERRKPGRPIAAFGGQQFRVNAYEFIETVPGDSARLNSLPSAFADSVSWSRLGGPTFPSVLPTSDRLTQFNPTGSDLGGGGAPYFIRLLARNVDAGYAESLTGRLWTNSNNERVVFSDNNADTIDIWDLLNDARQSTGGSDSCVSNCSCMSCHSDTSVIPRADTIFNLRDRGFVADTLEERKKFAYRQVVTRIDCRDPDNSLILKKPSGFHHAGGRLNFFGEDQRDYNSIRRWIVEGARYDLSESTTSLGAACEEDRDNDNVLDHDDNCPTRANSDQADADNDGIGNICELDTDTDSVIDDDDNCPSVANTDQQDTDSDGLGDLCDTPEVSVADIVVGEGDGTPTARIALSFPTPVAASVKMHTSAGTASAPTDYFGFSTEFFFNAGDDEVLVPLSIVDDAIEESTEDYRLRLFDEKSLVMDRRIGTVTILDDDAPISPPAVSVNDLTVNEGDGDVSVRVTLSKAATSATSVMMHTSAREAQGGQDFFGFSQQVDFAAGETEKLVALTIINDSTQEPTETLVMRLFSESGLTIARRLATVTILDDDAASALPAVSVGDVAVSEGAGTVSIPVTLSKASSAATSVMIHTSAKTAAQGQDYYGFSQRVDFAAGQTSASVSLTIIDDASLESSETLGLRLFSESGLSIGQRQGTVTITDND